VLDAEPGAGYARCIDGKRACPPEDCGGPWGYGELLEIIADPKHPEHEERREWMGENLTRRRSIRTRSTQNCGDPERLDQKQSPHDGHRR
jgi:pRiA4b ORF-3-like protein